MNENWMPFAIGKPTDATRIVGRENVPKGDDFGWWSCHSEYLDIDGEYLTIEELQDKHEVHWQRAWEIIEGNHLKTINVYVMNVNHPRYEELIGDSRDIVFDE